MSSFIFSALTCDSFAQPLAIVDNGIPESRIVYWNRCRNPVARFAAKELNKFVMKISSASIPVSYEDFSRSGEVGNISSAIVIYPNATMPQPSFDDLLITADAALEGVKTDGFVIQTINGVILLAGSSDRGTLYAVYSLLEQLGCRFFAPTFEFYSSHAEFIPQQATILLDSLNISEQPSFKYRRKDIGWGFSITVNTLPALIDWMGKNRLNVLSFPIDKEGLISWDQFRDLAIPEMQKRGIYVEVGGHGLYDYLLPKSVYEADHPDWFAQPDDPVVGASTTPPANVFHICNPEALQTFAANAVAYLSARPEIGFFAVWPPDGAKWPASDANALGGVENAAAFVVEKIRTGLADAGLNTKITALSYKPFSAAPASDYMYNKKTIIDFAPYDRSYAEPIFEPNYPKNVYYADIIQQWRAGGFEGPARIYEYYRKYSWHSLPVNLVRLIAQEIPFYRSISAEGISTYCEPADWLTYEVIHKLLAVLMWNTDLDSEKYLQDWLQDRFGVATPEMGLYFQYVEEAGRALFDCPNGNYQDVAVVTTVRENYLRAKEVLSTALSKELDDSTEFLIRRLNRNIEFAVADTEIDYYRLTGFPEKSAKAQERTKNSVEKNCFMGVILQSRYNMQRYDPTVDKSIDPWVYELYRNSF